MLRKRKIFYGWWIVLDAAILLFFSAGTFFYGFTVFFNPIRNTFGWTAAVTSGAFVLQRLQMGVVGPVAGFLADRVGPRKLIIPGWIIAGSGFLLMSRIDSLGAFYGSFMIIAVGMSFGGFVVSTTVVANWFIKKRSRAMTLVYAGAGVSGTLAPLLAWAIGQFGWRDTLTFVGIALWVIPIPLSLVMRHRPSQYGYLPDGATGAMIDEPAKIAKSLHPANGIVAQGSGSSAMGLTAKAALKTKAFWLLSLVFLFQHIGTSAVMVHLVPYLESVEIPRAIAAIAVTGMTLCSLIGRLFFGFSGDFTNKRYLVAIAITLQTIGIFLFSLIDVDRAWLIIPFLLTYGPGYGGPIPLMPALQADYFGIRSFGTIMGLLSIVSMLGGLTSPIIAGWIFDVTGSYRLAWYLFALVTVPAVPLVLLVTPPKR